VPWRLIGESVRVRIAGALLRVSHGAEVAVHARRAGRCVVDPAHFRCVAGFGGAVRPVPAAAAVVSRRRCANRPNTSIWSAGAAGDGPRAVFGDAHPAQADRDPR
jgi:hypothetical protein